MSDYQGVMYARKGYGYDTDDGNFRRLVSDAPVRLAPDEYAKPRHVIAYRTDTGERLHIRWDAIVLPDRRGTQE